MLAVSMRVRNSHCVSLTISIPRQRPGGSGEMRFCQSTLYSRFLCAFPRKVCARLMAPQRTDIAWRRLDSVVRCHGRQLIPPVRLPYRKEINARRSRSRDLRIVYYHAVLRNPFPTARRTPRLQEL